MATVHDHDLNLLNMPSTPQKCDATFDIIFAMRRSSSEIITLAIFPFSELEPQQIADRLPVNTFVGNPGS